MFSAAGADAVGNQSSQGSTPPGAVPGGITISPPVSGQVVTQKTGSDMIINLIGDAGSILPPNYFQTQAKLQAGAMGANTLGALCNTVTAIVALNKQSEATGKYYEYYNKVADNGMTVALAQVNLEGKKVKASENMQAQQLQYQEKVARLQSQTQVRLLKVEQQYKTKRAEIYAATEAFSRKSYSNGSPFATY